MSRIEDEVQQYFASLSSLNKRILNEQKFVEKSYGENWTKLTLEEQEDLFDSQYIDPTIAQEYGSEQDQDLPRVFPKLKIPCGEKIVVDLENEEVTTTQRKSML